jgi:hypothetical protein
VTWEGNIPDKRTGTTMVLGIHRATGRPMSWRAAVKEIWGTRCQAMKTCVRTFASFQVDASRK